MNTVKYLLIACILLLMTSTLSATSIYKKGETYNGFRLIEKRFVKEVNAECFLF